MGEVLGALLPIAVGVAVSPLPTVAVILVLTAPRGGANAAAFVLGWLVGLAGAVTLTAVLVARLSDAADGGGPGVAAGTLQLVLGALLLALAVRAWSGRPAPGEPALTPGWMRAIEGAAPPRAALIGAVLGGPNPKNAALATSAGATIGTAGLTGGQAALAVAAFCTVASLGVATPITLRAVRGAAAEATLRSWTGWLVTHNGAVVAALFLVLGANLVGNGLAALL